jgi:Protein of unknown function (DUF2786)
VKGSVVDDKLARIRALLAKAESTPFPNEADAFNAKAAELMARYGIEEALLHAAGGRKDTVSQRRIAVGNPYSVQKSLLLTVVSEALMCHCLALKENKSYTDCILFGFPSDLDMVGVLYTSLLRQMSWGMMLERGSGRYVVAHRKGWCHGFIAAVRTRLADANTQVTKEHGSSAALAVRDRSALAMQAARNFAPNASEHTIETDTNAGYVKGYEAGQRADVGPRKTSIES